MKVRIVEPKPVVVKLKNTVIYNTNVDGEKYDGEYVVEPSWEDQKLATKNKVMKDDVLVTKVPTYKTRNASGGYTVYVAERIE